MNSPAKFFAALFVACIFTISNSNLVAQSMHGLEELELATDYSAPYAGQALWFSGDWGPYTYFSSAVRINECWGLAAGHAFLHNGLMTENHFVGNGPNSQLEPGQTRQVSQFYIHPTWEASGGVWNGSRVDLVVIGWDQPLLGQNLGIASLSLGETFDYAGYARPATPSVGFMPYDGKRRGFEAGAHEWGNMSGTVSNRYVQSRFREPGHHLHLPLGGIGTGGGSGSGGINSEGNLVSLLVYQTNAPNYPGSSYGLRLGIPEIKDWIESYTNDLSCLPPPPRPPHGGILETAVRRDILAFCDYATGCF